MRAPVGERMHLECTSCGATYDVRLRNVCEACGRTLFARYDLGALNREVLLPRNDLWRYLPLLPVDRPEDIVTLGEGGTPLLRARNLEASFGLHRVFIKDEGRNPTGSFKARGMAVAVSKARELGASLVAVASAGNAGAALSAYSAKASLPAVIVTPKDTPLPVTQEMVGFGPFVAKVDGTLAEAADVVREFCEATGAFDLATLREPYRVEGKKTIGFEIWEQLGSVPNHILFPTGGGTGIVGLWKAFSELRGLAWTEGPSPKLVAVQAAGCAPVVRAFTTGRDACDPWPDPRTVAAGLRVPKPFADALILRALRDTGGTALAVSDVDMKAAAVELAHMEGVYACYEGAATLAAMKTMHRRGVFGADDTVVLVNSGSGFLNSGPPRTLKVPTVRAAEDLLRLAKR